MPSGRQQPAQLSAEDFTAVAALLGQDLAAEDEPRIAAAAAELRAGLNALRHIYADGAKHE